MPEHGEQDIFEAGVRAVTEEKLALMAFCGARDEESVAAAEAAFITARQNTLNFELMLPDEDFLAITQEAITRIRGTSEATFSGETQ